MYLMGRGRANIHTKLTKLQFKNYVQIGNGAKNTEISQKNYARPIHTTEKPRIQQITTNFYACGKLLRFRYGVVLLMRSNAFP